MPQTPRRNDWRQPTALISLNEHVGRHRTLRPGHLESPPLLDDDLARARRAAARLRTAEAAMADGRWDDAQSAIVDAFRLHVRLYGRSAPETVDVWLAMAELTRVMGERAEAIELLRELSAHLIEVRGSAHPLTVEARLVTVRQLHDDDRHVEARTAVDELFADLPADLPVADELHLRAREIRAEVYLTMGPTAGDFVVRELEELVKVRTASQKPDHPDILRVRSVLADAYESWRWSAPCVAQRREILEALHRTTYRTQQPLSLKIMTAHENLCRALEMDGEFEAGEQACRRLLHACDTLKLAAEDPRRLTALHQMALFVGRQGFLTDAEKQLRSLLDIRIAAGDRGSHQTALVWTDLVENLVQQERWDAADTEHQRAGRLTAVVIEPQETLSSRLRNLQTCIRQRQPANWPTCSALASAR